MLNHKLGGARSTDAEALPKCGCGGSATHSQGPKNTRQIFCSRCNISVMRNELKDAIDTWTLAMSGRPALRETEELEADLPRLVELAAFIADPEAHGPVYTKADLALVNKWRTALGEPPK